MALSKVGTVTAAEAMPHWDLDQDPALAQHSDIRSRMISGIRVSDMSGGACRGARTDTHTRHDKGDFVGVVCKLAGDEVCRNAEGEVRVANGDVMLWRNRGDLSFQSESGTRKLIMLVPETRFVTTLRKNFCGNSMVLSGNTSLGLLASSFMKSLCENLGSLDDDEAEVAIEMALDVVGLLVDACIADEGQGRSPLFDRVVRHIDRCLDDPELTPARIAQAHDISLRYLHLVFAKQGQTVSGWIRERRLLRCREELGHYGQQPSLTELAHKWGYSDSAHFSRSFKKRFGMPPRTWRESQKLPI